MRIGRLQSELHSVLALFSVVLIPVMTMSTSSSSTSNSIVRTYVLPDFVPSSTNKLGYLRPLPTGLTPPPEPKPEVPTIPQYDAKGKLKPAVVEEEEQLLQMNNERFTVPEVLFNPSTLGA